MMLLKNMLLVDDDDADIELIQTALEEHGLVEHIDIANDGAQAIDYLNTRADMEHKPSFKPELIVLDLKMPKVNGIEVLKYIKTHSLLQKIPVMVLTSSNEQKDIDAARTLGANAYIVKQVGFQALVDAVKKHIRRSQIN